MTDAAVRKIKTKTAVWLFLSALDVIWSICLISSAAESEAKVPAVLVGMLSRCCNYRKSPAVTSLAACGRTVKHTLFWTTESRHMITDTPTRVWSSLLWTEHLRGTQAKVKGQHRDITLNIQNPVRRHMLKTFIWISYLGVFSSSEFGFLFAVFTKCSLAYWKINEYLYEAQLLSILSLCQRTFLKKIPLLVNNPDL